MSSNWITPRLGEWLASLLGDTGATLGDTGATPRGDVAVTFGPPGPDGGPASQAGRTTRGVNLHLLTIAPHVQATTRLERRTELQLVLRYLATSWAEQRDIADSVLCTLAFHLLGRGAGGPDGRSEVVIDAMPPSLEILTALGVTPRPALILGLPLVYVDEPAPARRVLQPPIVRAELAETLRGTLVGPDELPIAAAQVEFLAFGLVTATDRSGRFRFDRVPADLASQTLRIRARGVEQTFQLSAVGPDGTLTLRMSFGEEG
jgi:hypothetical protein